METRKLGRFDVSVVGVGCNNFGTRCDESQTADVVDEAIERGINFFDTADVYGGGRSETFLGKALGSRRDQVVIATKFGNQMSRLIDGKVSPIAESGGGSKPWVKQAAEDSLKRLGTDRIDLYQMHVPDPNVPIQETLAALDELIEEGKVLEVGNSNFTADQIEEADATSQSGDLPRFVSAQNHYNLLNRGVESEVLPACAKFGLGQLPYFPLASGFLTGKYHKGEAPNSEFRLGQIPPERAERILNERNFAIVERLEEFAAGSGHSLLELAISWLAAQPTVASVIAGATKPGQVETNAAAATWKLSDAELDEIDGLSAG